ncbi:VOC family protein [Saxibacter everestensis]|uniref:VOC family protein n=1 Tax=Saxibacter everestensis TaxID=2909229 RepID=A0ABY8QVW8_9MICO|nr:VOC family protein [Brevibacteriaceae bacterium ZFBP1038]
MLQGISKVRVGVADQERAKQFWLDTMRCELAQDASYGEERWLEVRLPDGAVLILEQRDGAILQAPDGQPNTPVFFYCDDLDATWRQLTQRGVRFVQEPIDMPFGRWSLFEDTEGNRFPLTARA